MASEPHKSDSTMTITDSQDSDGLTLESNVSDESYKLLMGLKDSEDSYKLLTESDQELDPDWNEDQMSDESEDIEFEETMTAYEFLTKSNILLDKIKQKKKLYDWLIQDAKSTFDMITTIVNAYDKYKRIAPRDTTFTHGFNDFRGAMEDLIDEYLKEHLKIIGMFVKKK